MKFKEKDVYIFPCSIDVTKCDTVFSQGSKSLYVVGLFTPIIIVFLLFVPLKSGENVFKITKNENLI